MFVSPSHLMHRHRQVLEFVPKQRQTLFFTATWPKTVERLASTFLENPVQINIGSTDQLHASKSVTQVGACAYGWIGG